MIIWGELTSLFDKEIEGNRNQTFRVVTGFLWVFLVCVKKAHIFMGG